MQAGGVKMMNAKELAKSLKQASQRYSVRDIEVMAILYGASLEVLKLIPCYRDPRPEDDGKWCFLEELPSDAPPTLVRVRGEWIPSTSGFSWTHRWQFWTVAGWRELTKGVCPCERPEVSSS